MQTLDLIRRVRDRQPVDSLAVQRFVRELSAGEVPSYQAAAFLMATYLNGMADETTVALTLAMRDSGQVIDLTDVPGTKVDKHSTGGVGDKISIALAPLVAACGVPVPMVSGRGLGHTGGTLDKLESIPGFRVDLGVAHFRQQLHDLSVCLIGQTAELAPADKTLYALRDATATVESIPLITSSILSKKLAEGIDALLLDVKVGRGAFMKDAASARRLAESLVRVGTDAGLRVRALLTRMEEPLGTHIGNALEMREAIAILQDRGPEDTTELTLVLGAEMLVLGGADDDAASARKRLVAALRDGSGLAKLRDTVIAQGGDARAIDDPDHRLPRAQRQLSVLASDAGYIAGIDAYELGLTAMGMGAGRRTAEDSVDPAVGIELLARRGDRVNRGDPLAIVHHNSAAASAAEQARAVCGAFTLSQDRPKPVDLIIEVIDGDRPAAG